MEILNKDKSGNNNVVLKIGDLLLRNDNRYFLVSENTTYTLGVIDITNGKEDILRCSGDELKVGINWFPKSIYHLEITENE